MVSPVGHNSFSCGRQCYSKFCMMIADVTVSSMEPMVIGLGKFTDRVNIQIVILISTDERNYAFFFWKKKFTYMFLKNLKI